MSRDFKKHLQKQLKLLQKASYEYDYGDIDEAINIAIRLRVLLHDKGRNISLLTHLKQKNKLYFISTLETLEETRNKFLKEHGLIINQDEPPAMLVGSERKPPFGSWGIKKYLTFDVWWNEKILKINDKEYTRSDIVLITAEEEGGAHIDKKVNQKTKLLETGTGRFKYGTGNDDIQKELVDTHYLFLRQIAYKVLLIEKLFTDNDLEFTQPASEMITYSGLLQEAEKFLSAKGIHDAKSCLEKAIKYDPFRKEAYNNIGNIYNELGDVNKAIQEYKQAISIDSNYVDAQYNLANIYRRQRRYSLALDLYENILLENPDEYKTKYNRNYILLKLKEKEEMLYQYNTCFEKSKNALYLGVLSHELFQNREFEKALVIFKKILDLYGENAMRLSNLGASYIKLKDYTNAKKMYYKVIQQKEIKNTEAYLNTFEYLLMFDQDINDNFMKKCEEYFSENEEDYVFFDMLKRLLIIKDGVEIESTLKEFKSQYMVKYITYDFSDLLEISDENNLKNLRKGIEFLLKV